MTALQQASDSMGYNLIHGEISEIHPMPGFDKKTDIDYVFPTVNISHRMIEGSPYAIWFEANQNSGITMKCEFETEMTEGRYPLKLTDIKIYLKNFTDSQNPLYQELSANYLPVTPQRISAYSTFTFEEFVYLQESFAQGILGFYWTAQIPYYDLDNPKIQEWVNNPGAERPPVSTYFAKGETGPVFIDKLDDNAYAKVKSLLTWQHQTVAAGEVWYKDTMLNNTFDFMPQIYRIKADPMTNTPMMSIVMKAGENRDDFSSYRILIGFDIGPYFHPKAERDLYRIIKQRSSGKRSYCLFSYGGYDSSSFQWDPEFENGILNDLGIKALKGSREVETAPDSSFSISLESPIDSFTLLKEKLTEKSLYIGNVILETKEGLKETPKQIPIKVELDLRKLTGNGIYVAVLDGGDKKVNFPYQFSMTNTGKYPVEVGGCEMSYYSTKKGVVRDSIHGLQTTTKFPFDLEPGESRVLELNDVTIKELKKKNTFLGINMSRYWNELVCQPHSIRLKDKDITRIIHDYEDLATDDPAIWKLKLDIMDWDSIPNLMKLDFQLRSTYGEDITVSFNRSKTSEEVIMAKNLSAILSTMKSEEGKRYEYRMMAVYNDHAGEWTEWQSGDGNANTFYLYLSKYSL